MRNYGNSSNFENAKRLSGFSIDTTVSVKGYLKDNHDYNVRRVYLNKELRASLDYLDIKSDPYFFKIREKWDKIEKLIFGAENNLKEEVLIRISGNSSKKSIIRYFSKIEEYI